MKLALVALFAVLFAGTVNAATIGKGDVVAAPLASPTGVAPESNSLHDKLAADLNAAIVSANAAHDAMAPVRAKCYQTLLSHVDVLSNPVAPVGPISAFERAAEVAEGVDAGIPLDVRVDCAPVAMRARDVLVKFGLAIGAIK